MKLLEDRIRAEGKILPGDITKVDGFLNHRVDVSLLRECAKEFGRLFDTSAITCVVTIEASGIPIATVCAEEFGVPLIYAKKAKSENISRLSMNFHASSLPPLISNVKIDPPPFGKYFSYSAWSG